MRPVSHDPTSRACPSSTVRPDTNGWVPPGTCGYLARPYYPSFVAALVFCVFATILLIGYARITILADRRNAESPRGRSLLFPLAALLLSTCLLLAYVLRAIGTRHQQVTEFVAFSDTLVLMSPILIFAFDCSLLARITKALSARALHSRLTGKVPERSLAVAITFLAIEQLIASLLIAPKHRKSFPSGSASWAMLGVELYLGGIGVQFLVMMYTLFLALAVRKKTTEQVPRGVRVTKSMKFLISSLVSLLTRTIYRLVELSSFSTGYLLFLVHSEVCFYAFECLPILFALGIWLFAEPDIFGTTYLPDGSYTYHELYIEPEGQ